jgi:cytochrome c oxidase subunit 3
MSEPTPQDKYYVPAPTYWPIVCCAALFMFFVGIGRWLHELPSGPWIWLLGTSLLVVVLFGWFGKIINENLSGLYSEQVGRSFRSGMKLLILSEVVFFSGFFAAYFFLRLWVVPQLGGEVHPISNILLWPNFEAEWPLLTNPDNARFFGATQLGSPWDIPLANTLLLLTSSVTLTFAHRAIGQGHGLILRIGLLLTILLGIVFLGLQAYEYIDDYNSNNLTLNAGIYGSVFYLLTGFHGFHVLVGVIMISTLLGRAMKGHFDHPGDHFAIEGVAWYWHFVDVVWLLLFVFVYWL